MGFQWGSNGGSNGVWRNQNQSPLHGRSPRSAKSWPAFLRETNAVMHQAITDRLTRTIWWPNWSLGCVATLPFGAIIKGLSFEVGFIKVTMHEVWSDAKFSFVVHSMSLVFWVALPLKCLSEFARLAYTNIKLRNFTKRMPFFLISLSFDILDDTSNVVGSFPFFGVSQKVMHKSIARLFSLLIICFQWRHWRYLIHRPQESSLPFIRWEGGTYLTSIITYDISWLTPFAVDPVMKWFGWKYMTLDRTPVWWLLHTLTSGVVTLKPLSEAKRDHIRKANCQTEWEGYAVSSRPPKSSRSSRSSGSQQLHLRGLQAFSGGGDLESELARKEGRGGGAGRMGKEDSQPLPPSWLQIS